MTDMVLSRIILLTLISLVAACSSSAPPQTGAPLHLRHIAVLYGKYLNGHKGLAPKNEAEFKQFINGMTREQLDALAITPADPDGLFVSPRDGQPYVIRYRDASNREVSGKQMIAHEKEGKGGKRFVAYASTQVMEVDDSNFQPLPASGTK